MMGLPRKHGYHGFAFALLAAAVLAGCVGKFADPNTGAQGVGGLPHVASSSPRRRQSINNDWRFTKGDPPGSAVSLLYDVRPPAGRGRGVPPTTPDPSAAAVVKPWVLPTGNAFLKDPARRFARPAGNPGTGVPYIAPALDDSTWRKLDLPHDYAIEGPFTTTGGGGMGRLPSAGVAWYRKTFSLPASDRDKSIFLDIDGAMSYSQVWLNGQFVGGWPNGYTSFRLNLTPYAKPGEKNVLAVRLDNPPNSSRWYPGGGIYRNVWLVETAPVHVGQWGTYITTSQVSPTSASVALQVTVDNDSRQNVNASVASQIFELDGEDRVVGAAVSSITPQSVEIPAGRSATVATRGTLVNPKLWGTGPHQKPNRYVAVTTVQQDGKAFDRYETPFGVRTLTFDANSGFILNGERVKINGVCNHHDLGALGAAVNYRAVQRQLEVLADMGCNAIRTSHNPPAPELLELCDKMGFLVMDEAFDQWAAQKTPNDYHLLFADWHEQDLRAMLRRDRNHPSVIMWSIGNEVGEQSNDRTGIAQTLTSICDDEDPTRPTISGMNSAKSDSSFSMPIDTIGLNYQGAGLNRAKRPPGTPQYPLYHQAFPDKFIVGTETASTLSSRGFYTFPVAPGSGTAAAPGAGEMPGARHVSSYDVYFADWSYFPDKEFAAHDQYPFVAGEFVWTGFDYLGEPTPFDASRSSYFGIIDLAGFKKDRFYLYQAHWRPELPMAHILPHWNWPERIGQVTPVHVYTSGDEAELFVNGKSQGRKKKGEFEYRLRWDDVVYEPGEVRVVAYMKGRPWATDVVKTTDIAGKLVLTPDRGTIAANGDDLSFVTLTVADKGGQLVPRSMNSIHFEIRGPGEIDATDNGDPTDMTPFPSRDRKAFNGLALAIIRAKRGESGNITLTATSEGLMEAKTTIVTR